MKTITKDTILQMMDEEHEKVIAEGATDEEFEKVDALVDALGDPQRALEAVIQALPAHTVHETLDYIAQQYGFSLDGGGEEEEEMYEESPRTITREDLMRMMQEEHELIKKLKEARKRPLKRDREAFSRNTEMVSGLQKTITSYLKEAGAKLDSRHKEIIEKMSTRLMHVANSPMIKLEEGDATSLAITKLEEIGNLVKSIDKEIDIDHQPEVAQTAAQAKAMIQELWEEMHNLL